MVESWPQRKNQSPLQGMVETGDRAGCYRLVVVRRDLAIFHPGISTTSLANTQFGTEDQ